MRNILHRDMLSQTETSTIRRVGFRCISASEKQKIFFQLPFSAESSIWRNER